MPVSDILPLLRGGRLTSQQIADFMLDADQDRRAAMKRGDYVRAARLQIEIDELGQFLNRS